MSEVPEIRPPTNKGGYCYHCDRRSCIYPTCEDIVKARLMGFTDQQIIEAVEERKCTST